MISSKTCAGEMFRALMTRMVDEYNGLLARLSHKGFHSDATEMYRVGQLCSRCRQN